MRKLLMLVLVCFAAAARAQDGALELTEKQTVAEWEAEYKPFRDVGHEAMRQKDYENARTQFVLAAAGTRFAWVRARMLANAGFAALLNADKEGAAQLYNEAKAILKDNPKSGGEKFSKERAQCEADVKWGLSRCGGK